MPNIFKSALHRFQDKVAKLDNSRDARDLTVLGTFGLALASIFMTIDNPDTRPSAAAPFKDNGAYTQAMDAMKKASASTTALTAFPSYNEVAQNPELMQRHQEPPPAADMSALHDNIHTQIWLNPAISEAQAFKLHEYYNSKFGEIKGMNPINDDDLAFRDECLIGNNSGTPDHRMNQVERCASDRDSSEKWSASGKFALSAVGGAAGATGFSILLGGIGGASRRRRENKPNN